MHRLYLHVPKELIAGKFESRSKKCYFVGYCPNGYRLWNPEERKILCGKDIFDETKFNFEDSTCEDWILESDSLTANSNEVKIGATDLEENSELEGNNLFLHLNM